MGMKKLSIEEEQSMKIMEGDIIKEKEMYNNEMSETKQSKTEERKDGALLILTDTKKRSREAFMRESHDTRHYEQAEIMTGADPSETVKVTESMFESETLNQAAGVSSDVTAATAHICPPLPDSSSKIINNAQSNIQCHSIGLTQGVEFSIDPKEKESSQTNANNASPEEGERGRKEESILESPTTESVPWSD